MMALGRFPCGRPLSRSWVRPASLCYRAAVLTSPTGMKWRLSSREYSGFSDTLLILWGKLQMERTGLGKRVEGQVYEHDIIPTEEGAMLSVEMWYDYTKPIDYELAPHIQFSCEQNIDAGWDNLERLG